MNVIDVHGLVKRFGDKTVVDHVTMTVAEGEIVGFLGPNGSGKTTTIRIMCGLLTPDEGEGTVLGFDIRTDKHPIPARRVIPHHLIDIADPTTIYTAAQYARDAARIIRDIHARANQPILDGGTGF